MERELTLLHIKLKWLLWNTKWKLRYCIFMLGYKKETGTPLVAGESMTMVGQEFQDKPIALFRVWYTQDILMKQWENVESNDEKVIWGSNYLSFGPFFSLRLWKKSICIIPLTWGCTPYEACLNKIPIMIIYKVMDSSIFPLRCFCLSMTCYCLSSIWLLSASHSPQMNILSMLWKTDGVEHMALMLIWSAFPTCWPPGPNSFPLKDRWRMTSLFSLLHQVLTQH